MKAAIVGKNGVLWNAKATIDLDSHEQCKQLAHVLLEQRNEMYNHIQQDIGILQRECKNHVLGSYQLIHLLLRIKSKKALLAKARGEIK